MYRVFTNRVASLLSMTTAWLVLLWRAGRLGCHDSRAGRRRSPGCPGQRSTGRHHHLGARCHLRRKLHAAREEWNGMDHDSALRGRHRARGDAHHARPGGGASEAALAEQPAGRADRARRTPLAAGSARAGGGRRQERRDPRARRRLRRAKCAVTRAARPGHRPLLHSRRRRHRAEALRGVEQRRDHNHELSYRGLQAGRTGCPGDRRVERSRAVHDQQQLPRGRGPEPDFWRGRSVHSQPRAERHSHHRQPGVQAA